MSLEKGDVGPMQLFVNETLGETWELAGERTDEGETQCHQVGELAVEERDNAIRPKGHEQRPTGQTVDTVGDVDRRVLDRGIARAAGFAGEDDETPPEFS